MHRWLCRGRWTLRREGEWERLRDSVVHVELAGAEQIAQGLR